MNTILNQYLADLVVEYHKLQNFHWYVKGKDFFEVHAKLEELYDGLIGSIDEVAEAVLMNGGKPLATLREFLAVSRIEEHASEHLSSSEIFKSISEDFTYLLESVKKIKKQADAEELYNVSAMMDSYIAEYSKMLWMIRSLN